MKYVTTIEAAKVLNCSEQTVRRKIRLGQIKKVKKCPCKQAWLISKNEIFEILNQGEKE
jgi:excisionase family DNA binding protein